MDKPVHPVFPDTEPGSSWSSIGRFAFEPGIWDQRKDLER